MNDQNLPTFCDGNVRGDRHFRGQILKDGYRILLLIGLALLALRCKDDQTTGPPPVAEQPFNVSITVKDGSGQGIPGLRISAWSKLPFSLPNGDGTPPGVLAVTSVPFLVGSLSRVNLSLFEMDGSLHSSIWIDTLSMGSYVARVSIHEFIPTHVYKCRMVARALVADSIMFRDSIYVVLHQPDASIGILGWTDQSGKFQSSDTLLFPNVLGLPPIPQTGPGGPQPLGSFSIGDTLLITLTDTTTARAQTFTRAIHKGANDMQLIWNPVEPDRSIRKALRVDKGATFIQRMSGVKAQWALEQNYPNPFD